MIALNNVAAPDAYNNASTVIGLSIEALSLFVFNNSVSFQIAKKNPGGGQDVEWLQEQTMAPGSAQFPGAVGIRFKNAVAGSVARIILVAPEFDKNSPDPGMVGYTPSTIQLAASGAITTVGAMNTAKKITQKDVVNTAVETDLFNGEITLNKDWLGTGGVFHLLASGDMLCNAGLTPTITYRLKLGGVTYFADASAAIPNNAGRDFWTLDLTGFNVNATNVQNYIGSLVDIGRGGNAAATGDGGLGGFDGIGLSIGGSGTRDTTADQLVEFTVQWSAANALHSFRLNRVLLVAFHS